LNEYEVYRDYVALKRHFTSPTYDYHRYNGRTNVTVESYAKRRDKYFFKQLAKEKDPHSIILANLIASDKWIGEISVNGEARKIYTAWMKTNQSLTYIFETEINSLDLRSALVVKGGHPDILRKYYRGEIRIETVAILMDILRLDKVWDEKMKDDPMWQATALKLRKYLPFLTYNSEKMLSIVKKILASQATS